jgi:hypothetical protein
MDVRTRVPGQFQTVGNKTYVDWLVTGPVREMPQFPVVCRMLSTRVCYFIYFKHISSSNANAELCSLCSPPHICHHLFRFEMHPTLYGRYSWFCVLATILTFLQLFAIQLVRNNAIHPRNISGDGAFSSLHNMGDVITILTQETLLQLR